jgi:3-(3-hydroxy-phenyl)propionate hydroxylase
MTAAADFDVVIVGYGPVGAAMAALLGRHEVRTLVVDRAPGVLREPRAIALDNEALRILQMTGLADDAFARVVIPQVRLRSPYVGDFVRLDTAGTLDGHPLLVTFYQPDLEEALRAQVAQCPSVVVRTGVRMVRFDEAGDGLRVVLREGSADEEVVTARYLVGADGASSRVRAAIGQDLLGETYAEDWLIVDALDVPGDFDHVEFLCDPARPMPHMIAPGGRTRWEMMLRPGETRAEMESDAKVAELLRPWVKPEELHIERRAVYRFQARACARFRVGRVFLVGDAAHVTPPFAGQGLVAGLRDAANLAWKLAWVLHDRASSAILETYDEERRPHAVKMIALAKLMGRTVMPRSRARAILVHGAIALVRKVPWIRRYLDGLGMKPKNVFPRGLLVRGGRGARAVRGALFPQIERSDEQLGPHLALVGIGVDPGSRLSAESRERWARAGGRTVQLAWPGERRWPVGRCYVVRPDRTILHDGPIADVDRLVEESLAMLAGVS